MIKYVYSVYDQKAGLFSTPFYQVRREAAQRDFGRATNDPGNVIYDNPSDFDLFELGTWEDESGIFELYPRPEFIQNASFLRKFDGI